MTDPTPLPADRVCGSVLVVGGGIGGIQAALDLAESGYYVYLAETGPAIGGRMPQLDKTFPTNDCSMCILSPKLVECGRHLNVDVLPLAEVVGVSGEPGRYTVDIRRKPRFVDVDKCTGCADCEAACPVSLPNEFDQGIGSRKAIFRSYPQAFPNAYAIDKRERPPCVTACPASVNPQGYIALAGEGKYQEALELIYRELPLPGTLGRICPHPCESQCRRKDADEPLAICDLKRFVADQASAEAITFECADPNGHRVAIVGSGPAGLTAAHYLAIEGCEVTVLEAAPVLGGMLATGIPKYRLPRPVLDREIDVIRRLGVQFRTGLNVGRDVSLDSLLDQGYGAVFLAVGAQSSTDLGIANEDAAGVEPALDFLRRVNLGPEPQVSGHVLVVGGGDCAIDAARCARRLGAERVTVVYRRTRQEMPATDSEIEAALEEGIGIEFLLSPVSVIDRDGACGGLRCMRMELGEPDESGRRRPVPIEGSEFDLLGDMAIVAIGQAPDLSLLAGAAGIEATSRGTVRIDEATHETGMPGVFAGGDACTGPSIAIEAVAAGKRAAKSIMQYLRGEPVVGEPALEQRLPEQPVVPEGLPAQPRRSGRTLDLDRRLTTFDEVDLGLSEADAAAEAKRCLNCGVCSECMECVRVCKPEAILPDDRETIDQVEVGAVVLAPGADLFDSRSINEYGYGRLANVVSSLDFERMLSASGPSAGHLLRPSDQAEPQRIAWLQCVGSRNQNQCENGYCSAVCCMYAIKEAVIAKEHSTQDLDAAIFFMDMRTYGKDFERYYDQARDKHGVRFVRSRVHTILEDPSSRDLVIRYAAEDSEVREERFDMVVLSTGLEPPRGAQELAKALGIELDHYGFCKSGSLASVRTSRPGVFACGAFEGPKDIPETVMQASAAAAQASAALAPARWSNTVERELPPERDVRGEPPRIGVFVCHCGINIADVVDVKSVVEHARGLRNVVFVDDTLYTCSQDSQEHMKEVIEQEGLNRVVVASCSPRTHEPIFQQTCREAGLNAHLFEMANIRDHASWVHMNQPEQATAKARDLVSMAVAKARLLTPLARQTFDVTKAALVVGGGAAGMAAALNLADQGFHTHVVEATDLLGGHARNLHLTLEGDDAAGWLEHMAGRLLEHPNVTVHLGTRVVEVSGFVGNFTTTLANASGTVEIEHGVSIIATGGQDYSPTEYCFEEHSRSVTATELERLVAEDSHDLRAAKTVAFIQCVGSREPKHPYCSRVCCGHTVKLASRLKDINPRMHVFVLYRDMRTYGLKEDAYKAARDKGVVFVRYNVDDKPSVEPIPGPDARGLRIIVTDHVLGEPIQIDADFLALATAIRPGANEELSKLFKVPLNADGFFLEAHMKLRPVDFATDGVFLCGLAHGPKTLAESITQAHAAAGRAATVLAKDQIEAPGTVAEVNDTRCAGCGLCESLCPSRAIAVDPESEVAVVNRALCKGCGLCASSCRSGAVTVHGMTDAQIVAMIGSV